MSKPLRVLIVEDSKDDEVLLLRELRRGGFDPAFERVDTAETMSAALDATPLRRGGFDPAFERGDQSAALDATIICDHDLPAFSVL